MKTREELMKNFNKFGMGIPSASNVMELLIDIREILIENGRTNSKKYNRESM